MKERPILFSTEMVKAILRQGNPKTKTRRVIKKLDIINDNGEDGLSYKNSNYSTNKSGFHTVVEKCPYGQVGDILWVRETWCKHKGEYLYKADDIDVNEFRWKPSIHMPKEACRLRLKIKSIRVERLLDISERDAIAEGIQKDLLGYIDYLSRDDDYWSLDARNSYFSLWDKINGKNSHKENPYVWVIEFERLT